MNLHSDTTTAEVKPDRTHVDWVGDNLPGNTGKSAPDRSMRPTMRGAVQVLEVVAAEYGVTVDHLKAKDRHRTIACARQVACWLLRETRNLSYPEIGIVLQKDHTTCISAVRKVERSMNTDREFRRLVERLRDELRPVEMVVGFESGRFG